MLQFVRIVVFLVIYKKLDINIKHIKRSTLTWCKSFSLKLLDTDNKRFKIYNMDLIIVILVFFIILVPVVMVANKVGEQIEKWLEEHFPNVEE